MIFLSCVKRFVYLLWSRTVGLVVYGTMAWDIIFSFLVEVA